MQTNFIKYLLTAMLLLCCSVGFGQRFEKNSIPYNVIDSTYKYVEVGIDTNYGYEYIGEDSIHLVIPSNVTYNGVTYTVTHIGNSVFNDYPYLGSVTIPSSVSSIDKYAFKYCKNLNSITISNSVTSIGDEAFNCCDKLISITVDPNNPVYDSRNNCNAIIETKTNTLIQGCQTTIIPNTVKSIGRRAFEGCDNLTNITIPRSVTSIGYRAFSFCNNLTNIVIPNSVKSIEGYAFIGCDNLTSLIIPQSVKTIGSGAFYNCRHLKTITLPRHIKEMIEQGLIPKDFMLSCENPLGLSEDCEIIWR